MTIFTVFQGSTGNDTLNGTADSDVLLGDAGNDRLNGGEGGDILDPGAGTNQIDAGGGNDLILIDGSGTNGYMSVPANGVDGGTGYDTVVYSRTAAEYHIVQIAGGNVQVTDLVTGARDTLANVEHLQFSDTDLLLSPAPADLFLGTAGADSLTGDDLGQSIYGFAGNDSISGLGGDDYIDAGDGTNRIDAGVGNDTIVGGQGTNGSQLTPANGIEGGAGIDTVTYMGAASQFHVTRTAGTNWVTVTNLLTGSRDILSNVERLQFSDTLVWLTDPNQAPVVAGPVLGEVTEGAAVQSFSALANATDPDTGDVLRVTDLPAALPDGVTFDVATQSFVVDPDAPAFDALSAGQSVVLTIDYAVTDGFNVTAASASFTIHGVDAVTLITGTASANVLIGTTGADAIFGLGGNDQMKGLDGSDVLDGGTGADTLLGGAGDDRIVHDGGDRLVDGGTGNDTLVVSGTTNVNLSLNDQVKGDKAATMGFESVDASGASGAVTLHGSAGANVLVGGSGADFLEGGRGADNLTGGQGADCFIFASTADSGTAAFDQITDFLSGSDRIDLRGIDAIVGGPNDAFTFIGAGDFSAAGQLRYDPTTGVLEGDTNGDRLADFHLDLGLNTQLLATDIIL